ncbi:MAG: YfiR family protein [Gemmatimonadota bacterium]
MPSGGNVRGLRLAVVGAALCLAVPLVAAEPRPAEYVVKAAFLYNFARFAEWPTARDPDAPLIICVLGEDPFGEALEGLAGGTVRGQKIAVRRAARSTEVEPCDILFISASEAPHLAELLPRYGSEPILTVSDIARFAESGGIVQLTMSGNRVRFRVNVAAAGRAGIRLSAKLLRLGEVVDDS